MRLKVRKAKSEDALEAWKLITQLQDFLGLEITPFEEFINLWNKVAGSSQFEAFVAEEEGKIKGLATVWFRESLSHGGWVALIDEFIVAEGERGRGIGTRLLEHVVNECFREGCIEVEITTEEENFVAREFYRKLGFYKVGILLEREREGGVGYEES